MTEAVDPLRDASCCTAQNPVDTPDVSGHPTPQGDPLERQDGVRKLVLVTPNISQDMGGEAIKAYQFLRHLVTGGRDVTVVTHRRSASVLQSDFPAVPRFIIEDTPGQVIAWHAMPLRPIVDVFFFRRARAVLRGIFAEHPDAVFHYLCPISPILPRFPLAEATNVLGPLTGNIYYPPGFRRAEPIKLKLGRLFHYVAQRVVGAVFGDKRHFGRILVSGGERTRRSLGWAGASAAQMEDVVDSGISDRLLALPAIRHAGHNSRFMTSSRLVPYKGVQLTIAALAHVPDDIHFDIYGDGAYRSSLEALAKQLGVTHKVSFMGWTRHDDLIAVMPRYRAFVAPSLAEANGISVQEAMMAGLPVICLKWGGPELLADARSAVLIEPGTRDQVIREVAAAMTVLAADPERANDIAGRARAIAEQRFSWNDVAGEWQGVYESG